MSTSVSPLGISTRARRRLRMGAAVLHLVLLIVGATAPGGGTPWTPPSESQVLVRLPAGVRSPMSAAEATPKTGRNRLDSARALIRSARHEGDPRLLSRALLLLRSGHSADATSTEALYLRAQARQGLHDFRGALADLTEVLRHEPGHVGAWLTKATVHQVLGEHAEARHACLQLTRFADPLTSITAVCALAGVASADRAPIDRLAATLATDSGSATDVETRVWAWTTLGELQALHGDVAAAERSLRRAVALDPAAPYPRAALADVFLAAGRPLDVRELLGTPAIDSLRLRLAEAEQQLDPDGRRFRELDTQLTDGFELARRRGDELHLREHARFLLHLRHDPAAALALARRNWEIQKETADLELLLGASAVAGDLATRDSALAWATRHMPPLALRQRAVAGNQTRPGARPALPGTLP